MIEATLLILAHRPLLEHRILAWFCGGETRDRKASNGWSLRRGLCGCG